MSEIPTEFIPYTPIDKAKILGIKPFEIYVFMSPQNNRWFFELVDMNDMSLTSLNLGGMLYATPYYCTTPSDYVYSTLAAQFPDAEVFMYPSMDAWYDCCHPEYKQ